MRAKPKVLFASFFFVYFTCVAVLPVSAVVPFDKSSDVSERENTLEKRSSRPALFFVDLALWEILTKTKQSDDLKAVLSIHKKESCAGNIDLIAGERTAEAPAVIPEFLVSGSSQFTDDPSLYVFTGFTCSGLPPPLSRYPSQRS